MRPRLAWVFWSILICAGAVWVVVRVVEERFADRAQDEWLLKHKNMPRIPQ